MTVPASGGATPSPRRLSAWLWRGYLAPEWRMIVLALLLMAVEGATLGGLAAMMEPMFDRVFRGGGTRRHC